MPTSATSLTAGELLAYLQTLPEEQLSALVLFEAWEGCYPARKEIRVVENVPYHPDSENTKFDEEGNELPIPGPFLLVGWDAEADDF